MMGLFGTVFNGMVGMYSANRGASAQEFGAKMQHDASLKRDASSNMRNAVQTEKKATKDLLDQGTRSVQMQQQSFNDMMGVMRDSYLRGSGMRRK